MKILPFLGLAGFEQPGPAAKFLGWPDSRLLDHTFNLNF